MKPIRRIAALAVALALVIPAALLPAEAFAQGSPEGDTEAMLELLRSDVRTDKTAVMGANLKLSEAESDKFWPIYRAYSQELSVLGDRRLALIKKFAAEYGSVTDDSATEMAGAWFDLENDYLKLLKKTHASVSKELSPIVGARFVQIESALNMLVRLQISAGVPLVE